MALTPLSRKLTLLMGAVTAVALVLGGAASATLEYFAVRRSIVQELQAQAEVVGFSAGLAMAFEDRVGAGVELANLKASRRVQRAALYSPRGQVYAVYPHDLQPRDFPPLPPAGSPSIRIGGGVIDLFSKNEVGDGVGNYIYLRGSMEELWPRVLSTLKVQGVILAVVFGLVLLLALRLQRTLSDPLIRLVGMVQSVEEEQDYRVRVRPEEGSLEIFRLGEGFNRMIGAVQERDLRLLDHQNRLEDQVAARTEELTRVNTELRGAKNRAEDASRAKSAFLANMSHELRTPLNAVLLYSELLHKDAEDEGLPHLLPDIQRIHGAGKHLLGLIDGILDLSRIETGRMAVGPEGVDLQALVSGAFEVLRPRAEAQGNRLVCDVGGGLEGFRTDPKKLALILHNLLENAVKFTRDGSVDVRARREGERVRLEVRDTGIGMAPEQAGRIFQEFTQADESSTRRYGGMGLGLTLSQRLCQLLGGSIEVESVEGRGTCFTLRLPLEPRSASAPLHFSPCYGPEGAPDPRFFRGEGGLGHRGPAILEAAEET